MNGTFYIFRNGRCALTTSDDSTARIFAIDSAQNEVSSTVTSEKNININS